MISSRVWVLLITNSHFSQTANSFNGASNMSHRPQPHFKWKTPKCTLCLNPASKCLCQQKQQKGEGKREGHRGKKDLQTTQMNNCKQPLKLIRTKCQKQNFEDFIDIYSKTHFSPKLPCASLFGFISRTCAHSSRCGSKNEIRRTLVFWSKLLSTALVRENRL